MLKEPNPLILGIQDFLLEWFCFLIGGSSMRNWLLYVRTVYMLDRMLKPVRREQVIEFMKTLGIKRSRKNVLAIGIACAKHHSMSVHDAIMRENLKF